jgi:peptidoglycan/xylan/chitin deacetylase (PgdA/CDA1 family)
MIGQMLRFVKLPAFWLLKNSGLSSRIADSAWRRDRLLILCYHGISLEDEHLWDPALYMAPEQFRGRMRLLEQNRCHVLPLAEALRRLHARTLPPRSVVLTFDDGFADFAARAFPILREYGFPATVYLTTYYCEHATPVFTVACRYILWKQRGLLVPGDSGFVCDLDLRDAQAIDRSFRALLAFCEKHGLSGAEKHSLLEQVARRLGFDFDGFLKKRILQILTPDETSSLAAAGVDFQLHTHRHRTPLDAARFRAEIEDNRSRVMTLTGQAPQHFCYPSGIVEPCFLPWLRDLGVVSATTCEHGLSDPSCALHLLPRHVDVSAESGLEFESWLSGVGAWFSRRAFRLWHDPRTPVYVEAHKDVPVRS